MSSDYVPVKFIPDLHPGNIMVSEKSDGNLAICFVSRVLGVLRGSEDGKDRRMGSRVSSEVPGSIQTTRLPGLLHTILLG